MTRGRKAQPDAVAEAKGNPGKRPPEAKPAPDTAPLRATSAPAELSADAKKIWERLVPDLKALNLLRNTDVLAIARYCEHMAKWWELTRQLRGKKGFSYITESQHGKMERVRPAFLIRERIEKRMEALEDRFGLNPAARQTLLRLLAGAVPPGPPGDLFGNKDQPDGRTPGEDDSRPPSPIGLLGQPGATKH